MRFGREAWQTAVSLGPVLVEVVQGLGMGEVAAGLLTALPAIAFAAFGEVIREGESFGDPQVRERLNPLARSLSPETCVRDGQVDHPSDWKVCGFKARHRLIGPHRSDSFLISEW